MWTEAPADAFPSAVPILGVLNYPFVNDQGKTVQLYWRVCPGDAVGQWIEVTVRTAREVAVDAAHDLEVRVLPRPRVSFTPLDKQFGWSWVKLPIDIRLPGDVWRPVSVTADAGVLSVTVTATPIGFVFDGGDWHDDAAPPLSCDGAALTAAYDPKVPGVCSYTY